MDTVFIIILFSKINYYDDLNKKIKVYNSGIEVIMMNHIWVTTRKKMLVLAYYYCVIYNYKLACNERNTWNICIFSKFGL